MLLLRELDKLRVGAILERVGTDLRVTIVSITKRDYDGGLVLATDNERYPCITGRVGWRVIQNGPENAAVIATVTLLSEELSVFGLNVLIDLLEDRESDNQSLVAARLTEIRNQRVGDNRASEKAPTPNPSLPMGSIARHSDFYTVPSEP